MKILKIKLNLKKKNWVRDRKIHEDLIKKGYSRIQEKIKKSANIFLRQ